MADGRLDSEEAIIAELWAPLAAGFPGAFGLVDDCAAISPGAGRDLIVTTDAVIAGVHFLPDEDPGAIAWKALAVNVSDLIGKGATPLAYLMTIALPVAPERAWLRAFVDGLRAAQEPSAVIWRAVIPIARRGCSASQLRRWEPFLPGAWFVGQVRVPVMSS